MFAFLLLGVPNRVGLKGRNHHEILKTAGEKDHKRNTHGVSISPNYGSMTPFSGGHVKSLGKVQEVSEQNPALPP